jgi:Fe2+ or Zn2+ uptake regulation protein
MSRQSFIQAVEALFDGSEVSTEAREYFVKNFKTAKTSAKDVARATQIREAILAALKNRGELMDRYELADKMDAEIITNDKGGLAYNSVTAYANQLVEEGLVQRKEVKVGKAKRVKYSIA